MLHYLDDKKKKNRKKESFLIALLKERIKAVKKDLNIVNSIIRSGMSYMPKNYHSAFKIDKTEKQSICPRSAIIEVCAEACGYSVKDLLVEVYCAAIPFEKWETSGCFGSSFRGFQEIGFLACGEVAKIMQRQIMLCEAKKPTQEELSIQIESLSPEAAYLVAARNRNYIEGQQHLRRLRRIYAKNMKDLLIKGSVDDTTVIEYFQRLYNSLPQKDHATGIFSRIMCEQAPDTILFFHEV